VVQAVDVVRAQGVTTKGHEAVGLVENQGICCPFFRTARCNSLGTRCPFAYSFGFLKTLEVG